MAEDLPAPDPTPRRRPLRGILRWLVRFFVRASFLVAGVLLLVSLLALLLYLNRVRLLNQALAVLVEPFRVSVEEIDFTPLGTIRVQNLLLSPKGAPADALLASIPEVLLTYRFSELRNTGRFENLTIREADVRVDEAILSAFSRPANPQENQPPPEPFLLSRLALFTGALVVEDSRFLVAIDMVPRIEGRWSFHTEALDFEASGLSRTPFAWRLSEIRIGPEARDGSIAALSGEGRVTADLQRFEFGPLHLERPRLRVTPQTLAYPKQKAPDPPESISHSPTPAPDSPAEPSTRSFHWQSLAILDGQFSIQGFDGQPGGPILPDLAFDCSFTSPPFRFAEGRWHSEAPLELVFREVQAGSGGLPFLSTESIRLELDSLESLLESHRIGTIVLEKADLLVTNETLARFLSPRRPPHPDEEAEGEADAPAPPATSEPDEGSSATAPWIIDKLEIQPSTVLLRDLDLGETRAPEVFTSLQGTLRDLRFGGGQGFASEGTQSLLLEQTHLRPPGAAASAAPLLSTEKIELDGQWAEFQSENILDRLVIHGPRIEFTDEALGDWLRGAAPSEETPRPIDRPVFKARHFEARDGQLVADSSFATGRVPKVHATFSLETSPPRNGDPYSYRLHLEDFAIRNHARALEAAGPPSPQAASSVARQPLAEGEVFRVQHMEVDFTASGLQRTRRIDKLKMDGAVLTVGEGLKAIAGDQNAPPDAGAEEAPSPQAAPAAPPTAPEARPQATAPPLDEASPPSSASSPPATDATNPSPAPSAAPASRALPVWTLGEVEITRSRVHFESLIPQVEGLQFAIETKLTDLPLSLDGLLAQEAMQKIELAGIVIKDPYNSFITVAELPTIFVEFSLAGLARQEVERIDLIGPSLHVGQGLFWWIDYQRRFREQNEGASIGLDTEEAEKKPDWVVKTIQATAGKIVISPTGVPVGVVPFPFNATTNMSGGDIELKLNIPDEDHVYRFPDYKVELEGLTGDVQFNVPVKELDNNLVQTFTLRRAKWKDFDAKDLYITATFDEKGIYGNFGGAAYSGYAEGGFNFYLNDQGKWDAWVAGTDLDTGPITKILVPDSFLMEGRVSLKMIAEGRDKSVGETTGEFQTSTPGWFDITKLDGILENLPPEWNSLKRSLTELSLIALKRFDYDKGAGSLYFLNRAGKLELRFSGAYGTRELNLHLHDHSPAQSSASDRDPSSDRPRPAPQADPTDPVPIATAP